MGKRTSPSTENSQKELTNAAVVAQFLGIPVPPSANSLRVSEAIQRNIDGLIREIANLKSHNHELAEKQKIATEQIERFLQQARDLGITLTPGGKIRLSAPPLESEKSTAQIKESQSTQVGQDSQDAQWKLKQSRRSSRRKQGAAA